MKKLIILMMMFCTIQANAFLKIGCDEENQTTKELKSLEEEAKALRLKARSEEHYAMAREVLEHLHLYKYEIDKKASFTEITQVHHTCKVIAKKSSNEMCEIKCDNYANKEVPVYCYKRGTVGSTYSVHADNLEHYSH